MSKAAKLTSLCSMSKERVISILMTSDISMNNLNTDILTSSWLNWSMQSVDTETKASYGTNSISLFKEKLKEEEMLFDSFASLSPPSSTHNCINWVKLLFDWIKSKYFKYKRYNEKDEQKPKFISPVQDTHPRRRPLTNDGQICF